MALPCNKAMRVLLPAVPDYPRGHVRGRFPAVGIARARGNERRSATSEHRWQSFREAIAAAITRIGNRRRSLPMQMNGANHDVHGDHAAPPANRSHVLSVSKRTVFGNPAPAQGGAKTGHQHDNGQRRSATTVAECEPTCTSTACAGRYTASTQARTHSTTQAPNTTCTNELRR